MGVPDRGLPFLSAPVPVLLSPPSRSLLGFPPQGEWFLPSFFFAVYFSFVFRPFGLFLSHPSRLKRVRMEKTTQARGPHSRQCWRALCRLLCLSYLSVKCVSLVSVLSRLRKGCRDLRKQVVGTPAKGTGWGLGRDQRWRWEEGWGRGSIALLEYNLAIHIKNLLHIISNATSWNPAQRKNMKG